MKRRKIKLEKKSETTRKGIHTLEPKSFSVIYLYHHVVLAIVVVIFFSNHTHTKCDTPIERSQFLKA